MDALLNIAMPVAVAGILGYFWLSEPTGTCKPRPIAERDAANSRATWIGIAGVFVILLTETFGELALGISAQQSTISRLFLLPMLAAAVSEEVIFRGYLIEPFRKRGARALLPAAMGLSLLFTLLHDHFWSFELPEGGSWLRFWEGQLTWDFGLKAWFSSAILLANSLVLFAVRFGPWNPDRALLPCVIAHAVTNAGVYAIKWYQGFVEGWV